MTPGITRSKTRPSKNFLRSVCLVSGCTKEIFPMARPTIVRTVTGASASISLHAIFPLSVSNVQYSPGLRLSAGGAPAAGRTTGASSAATATIANRVGETRNKLRVRSGVGICSFPGWPGVIRMSILFLHVFFYIHGTDFSSVNIALMVDRHALRRAGRAAWRRIGNESGNLAVFRAADAHAALAAGIVSVTWLVRRFGVRHVHGVVLVDEDSAGTAKLFPFGEVFAVLREDLNTIVGAISDKQAALGIEGQGVRRTKLAGRRSQLSPGLDEFSVLGKFHDARIYLGIRRRTVSVRDENIAIGRHNHR